MQDAPYLRRLCRDLGLTVADRRARTSRLGMNQDAREGAGDARGCRNSIPTCGGSWEPTERVGGEHLRGTATVNIGRTLQSMKEAKKRSRRTMRSPGSRRAHREGEEGLQTPEYWMARGGRRTHATVLHR
jgi:hypothetical protein